MGKLIYTILIVLAFAVSNAQTSTLNPLGREICQNSIVTYTITGDLATCTTKTYTVTGGVFPDHSNGTTASTTSNIIKVKWNGAGTLSVAGCKPTLTSNFTLPPVPDVHVVMPITPIVCGSTSNFDVFILVNEPPSTVSISTAPNGSQSFSLPAGFSLVSAATYVGKHTEFGIQYNKYKAVLKPTNGNSTGSGTVKNYYNCGGGGEVYTTAKSFTIERASPNIPTISNTQPIIRCNSTSITASCNSIAGADYYQWESNGGVSIVSGNGTNSISISATSSGQIRVKAKANACSKESGWTSWFAVHYGVPTLAPYVTGTCSGYSLWLNDFAGTSYNWYANVATAGNGYLSSWGANNAGATPTNGEYIVIGEATNACGTVSYTFIVYSCSGFYRIAPNPARESIAIIFDRPNEKSTLPGKIELFSESSTKSVETINVKGLDAKNFVDGNKLIIDVRSLPRGTYYLHLFFENEKKEIIDTDKVRVILE